MTVPSPARASSARRVGGGRHLRRRGGEGGQDLARGAFVSPRIEDHGDCPNDYILGRLSLEDSVSSSPRAEGMTRSEKPHVHGSATTTDDASVGDGRSLSLVASMTTTTTTTTTAADDAPPSPTLRESPSSSKLYLKSIQYRLERKKSRSSSKPNELEEQQSAWILSEPVVSSFRCSDASVVADSVFNAAPPPMLMPTPTQASEISSQSQQRRMQLERGYPLHRENAERKKNKKKKTEQRFLRLSQKAGAYSRNRPSGSFDMVAAPVMSRASFDTTTARHPEASYLAGSTVETPKAKENDAPPRYSKRHSIGDGDATAGRAIVPPSPTSALLPPRPLASKGSQRSSMMPVLPPSFPLYRSRSSSPRRRVSSEDFGTDMNREVAFGMLTDHRTSSASNAARLHRTRSESPSARTTPPPLETFAMRKLRPTPLVRQDRDHDRREPISAGIPLQEASSRHVDGAASSRNGPFVSADKTTRSTHAPPRSPATRSEDVAKHRRLAGCETNRIDANAIRRSGSGTCPSSPSSVASTMLNLGTVAISQCIAPTLMQDDYRALRPRTGGRSSGEREPVAAAPAPFFLPGVLSSSALRTPAGGQPTSPGRSARRTPEPPVQASAVTLVLKRASNTRDELIKLKNELQKKRETKNKPEVTTRRGDHVGAGFGAEDGIGDTYQARKQHELRMLHGRRACVKRVRFSKPLITSIRHRPYTKAEDIDKLYFGEEELEELEADRATVEGDQFEMALVDPKPTDGYDAAIDSSRFGRARSTIPCVETDAATVSVTYTNKRVHRVEEGGDEVPFSPSDDTTFTYYE